MKGGDLKGIIGKGPKFLPEKQAKKIAKRILEATAIMHFRGITHRDLKPSVRISLSLSLSPFAIRTTSGSITLTGQNILLASEHPQLPDIRIADMGISRIAGNLSEFSEDQTDNPVGTWGYMAPEVVKYVQKVLAAKSAAAAATKAEADIKREAVQTTHKKYDDRITNSADLWSVGCVIFATLTGHSPYPDDKLVVNDNDFPREMLEYNEVSDLGIQFIMQLVKVASEERMSAEVALDHPWLLGA